MKFPEDEEQRNIIDKLANFVARNGPKFEELTKSKQRDNEKFSFLFGGDYHEYYKWKVNLEATQVEAQKKVTIEEKPEAKVKRQIEEFDVTPFKELLQKIITACTKDNIQNGKNWVVDKARTDKQLKKTCQYFLRRMLEENLPFQQKLHIVYLANDLLHHSRKKDLPQIQNSLEEYILPLVAMTFHDATPDQQAKLCKVTKIWDTQGFFKDDTRELLKKNEQLVEIQAQRVRNEREEMEEESGEKQPIVQPPIPQPEATKYEEPPTGYQGQPPMHQQPPPAQFNQWGTSQPPQNDQFHFFKQDYAPPQGGAPPPMGSFQRPPFNQGFPPEGQPGFQPFGQFAQQPQVQSFDYSHQSVDLNAPGMGPPAPMTFDYAHGQGPVPEGVPVVEDMMDPTIPRAPYFDLPAGLMVPLVKLWDCEYKPLDPKDIRLPIPQPPSERLLAALEAYYAPPSHDRPRDSQGWEKNGLYEFFKAKLKYIKDKEKNLEVFDREVSPPPSPEPSAFEDDEDVEQWIRPGPGPDTRRSPSRSPPPRRRSRSRSPQRKRSYSRSRSRSRSRSASPRRKRSRSRSRSYSRSPIRRSPIRRSPTPPEGFVGFETKSLDTRIEESNVGHQLLKKMGWGGQGLGKNEQGVFDPIRQAEIRDKQDKFKGVGAETNDPFENYRKTKSYTYGRPRR